MGDRSESVLDDEPDTYSVPRIEIAYEVRPSDDLVAASFDDAEDAFAYVDANGGDLTVWRVTSEKLVRHQRFVAVPAWPGGGDE
jgi:hypothetical protein